MMKEKRLVSSKILFEAISEQLACNRQAVFTVAGMSMWPLICHGRDQVIVEAVDIQKLKIGDIILIRASEEQYILHRITQIKQDYFETTGDGNLFRDGKFPYSCMIARTTKVIHNGKTIDCSNVGYRILSRIWMFLFPVRKYIFRAWFCIRKYVKFNNKKTNK